MIDRFQPNGVQFSGRGWGDEFSFQYESSDGYRFVRGHDDYYYYAELGAQGDFISSGLKIGMDPAPASSYHLSRGVEREMEMENERSAVNDYVNSNLLDYKVKMDYLDATKSGIPHETRLAVICVEFPDQLGSKTETISEI